MTDFVEKPERNNNEHVLNHDALIFSSSEDVAIKHKEHEKDEEGDETGRDKIIRLVVILLVVLMVLLSSSRLVFWLLQPEHPELHLHSFVLSRFNQSNSQLTVDWTAKFTVKNPDKKFSLIFSETFCYFTYKDKQVAGQVGQEHDRKFKPNENAELSFVTRGEVKDLGDDDRAMFKDIQDSVKNGRPVTYEMNLLASVVALADSWWDRKTGFHVSCGPVQMKFAPKFDSATALIGNNGQSCVFTQYGVN